MFLVRDTRARDLECMDGTSNESWYQEGNSTYDLPNELLTNFLSRANFLSQFLLRPRASDCEFTFSPIEWSNEVNQKFSYFKWLDPSDFTRKRCWPSSSQFASQKAMFSRWRWLFVPDRWTTPSVKVNSITIRLDIHSFSTLLQFQSHSSTVSMGKARWERPRSSSSRKIFCTSSPRWNRRFNKSFSTFIDFLLSN